MNSITYSYNWNNKLDCLAFTTIRLRNDNKYFVGAIKECYLHKKYHSKVKIIAIKHFLLSDLNEFMAYIDTGYSREQTIAIIKKMYKNSNINWATKQLSFILQRKM
ncbi:MAG: hypothetical protein HQ521_13530 [Bacteroidetes bacterium]|nr:hypothetical protein [Bacteroidota bacterium]